ncbi:ABC transporter substrate-binding protein [Paracoccus sp. 08]|uniref:ABC transporter substrate-binding protein n=1 Tax=Paracoccus sp. 08 TaxID=2606624 RepID=UPI002095DA2F|nr:ABC transporter substrate-binding protein [Paracoccus sp. 08]
MEMQSKRHAMLSSFGIVALGAMTGTAFAETDINVGALRLASQAPTFIAYEKGYFEDEGLEVDLKFFEAANALSVAVAGGDIDYGITSITGSLFNLAERGVVKVIAGALSEDPEIPGAVILASQKAYEAGLTEPSKIEGQSFGATTAGSSFHYMLAEIAQKDGFALDSVQLKPLQKIGAIVGALSTSQIDAWVMQPSIANKLLADGSALKIGEYNAYDPDYQVTAVFTSTEIATNEREQTEAFLRALSRGVTDYNAAFVDKTASEDEANALVGMVHKYVGTDMPVAEFAPSLTEDSMRVNDGLALSTSSVAKQLSFLQDNKLVSDSITVDMLVDPSYVATR